MEDGSLPRGKIQRQSKDTHQKSKIFGYKNKQTKQKKEKKSIGKIPYCPKTKDYCQGCITIGSILSFQDDMLFIELPGNARGILPLTEINDAFFNRLQNAIENEEELPNLENFFKIGDFIMATVTSSGTHPVDLTIRPEIVNTLLKAEEGQILWAAVKEKEDNGYLLDIGLDGLTGFLPFKGHSETLEIGQPLFVKVDHKPTGAIVRCSAITDVFFPSRDVEKPHFDSLRPTDILTAVVTSNSANGALACMVSGSFNGYCSRYSWPDGVSVGDTITVRPLMIDPAQKIVWISAIPRIVHGERPFCLDAKIGQKVETTVARIRANVGIECTMPDNEDLRAFISMKDTKSDVALAAGDKHTIRITERRAIDDLLLASDDPEIIELQRFCADDVKPGEVCDCTVVNVNLKIGVFVKLSPFLTAMCPKNYVDNITDIKKGQEMKCIVLSVIDGQVKIAMKPKLIENDKEKLFTLEDAIKFNQNNTSTPAIVRRSSKRALIVEFFNGLCGLVLANYLPVTASDAIPKQYPPGYAMNVYILNVDGDKINCSVISDPGQILKLGDCVTATVKEFGEDHVTLSLPQKYGDINAVILSTHFADYGPLSQIIWKSLEVGKKLHRVCLIRNPGSQAPAYFTLKRSIRDNVATIPKDVQSIKDGDELFGFVSGVESYGSFVSFFGRAGGLIHGPVLEMGQSVHVIVDQVLDHRVRLSAPSKAGDSLTFIKNFLKDASRLNGDYSIGNPIDLPEKYEENDGFRLYSFENSDWSALMSDPIVKDVQPRIIYVDVLSHTLFCANPPEKQPKIESDIPLKATVCAIFEPIMVMLCNGAYVLVPQINFNNQHPIEISVGQELDIKVSSLQEESEEFTVLIGTPEYLNKDQFSDLVKAKITTFTNVTCNAKLQDGRTVRIHRTQINETPEEGMEVEGYLLTDDNSTYLVKDPSLPQKPEDFHVGQQVRGIITKVSRNFLKLSLSPFTVASVPSLQLSISDRSIIQKPLTESFNEGDYFEGWISSIKGKSIIVSGSDPQYSGKIMFAKVTKIRKGNDITVRLSNGKEKKIDITDVSDEFVFNPLKRFRLKQVIDVIEIDDEYAATKPSAFDGTMVDPEIKEGNIIQGYVCHDSKGALLIRLKRGVTGRLPYDKIANCFIKEPIKVFPVGTVMKVKIMEIKDNTISLSSRHSDITGQELTLSDLKVGDVVEGFITSVKDFGVFVRLCDYANHSGLVHRSTLEGKTPFDFENKINCRVHVEVTNVDVEKEKISLKLQTIEEQTTKTPEEEIQEESLSEDDIGPSDNEIELDIEDEDEESEEEITKEKKKTEKLKEEEITQIEARSLAPNAPKTEQEFVQALQKNQFSSKLWIEFMNFHFAAGNVKRAEEVGREALKVFGIGEKTEKKNVYLALISLAVLSTESAEFIKDCTPIVDEAAQTIEPEPMWLRFAQTVQKNKPQYAADAWKLALRRCKGSVEVWSEYLSTFIEEGKPEAANDELKRALGGTFKEAKKDVIVELKKNLATEYFEKKFPEHGRTMFENLISEMPKDLPVWFQYIDSEEEYGDDGVNKARALYERLAMNDLKVSNMQKTLKRWLKFEARHGNDAARRKHISKIAADFKKRVTQSGPNEDEE